MPESCTTFGSQTRAFEHVERRFSPWQFQTHQPATRSAWEPQMFYKVKLFETRWAWGWALFWLVCLLRPDMPELSAVFGSLSLTFYPPLKHLTKIGYAEGSQKMLKIENYLQFLVISVDFEQLKFQFLRKRSDVHLRRRTDSYYKNGTACRIKSPLTSS